MTELLYGLEIIYRQSMALETVFFDIQKILTKDPNKLVRIALARNQFLHPEIQRILSSDESAQCELSCNTMLIPELFPKLFLKFKQTILFRLKWCEFKYNNPATQELLEKYLLLV